MAHRPAWRSRWLNGAFDLRMLRPYRRRARGRRARRAGVMAGGTGPGRLRPPRPGCGLGQRGCERDVHGGSSSSVAGAGLLAVLPDDLGPADDLGPLPGAGAGTVGELRARVPAPGGTAHVVNPVALGAGGVRYLEREPPHDRSGEQLS